MRALVAHAANDIRVEEHPVDALSTNQVLIAVERGGICGSDLHYYQHGGFGTVRLKQPMILGHEIAGKIIEVGPLDDTSATRSLSVGQRVAVSPSRPCYQCQYCQQAQHNHCLNMRFYGSAMPFPHIQGAFRDQLVADVSQCAVADNLSAEEAAMAEPLAVCIHAANQAGSLVGKRVLVTGCGPIGLLCMLVAQRAGAIEVVATDIADFPLSMATQLGANTVINVANDADGLSPWSTGKGYFDVHFECSGVAAALSAAVPALRPGACIVQLGLGGDMTVPMQQMTAKEIKLCGSFRFHEEFHTGIAWMNGKKIDVKPLLTHTYNLQHAVEAFTMASDRSQAMKVQLQFQE